jgi:hypothetical protein
VECRISTFVPDSNGDVLLMGAAKIAMIDLRFWFFKFGYLQLLKSVNKLSESVTSLL